MTLPKIAIRGLAVSVERDGFMGGVGLDDELNAPLSYLYVEAMAES